VLPDYPMARSAECPFDPAPELRTERRLTRVRIWDGSTPWLVTRHDDQRTLLRDRRVSADAGQPGYPAVAPVVLRSRRFSFFLMDDPEHARLRRMVMPPFAIKRVEAMRPTAQRIVDDLIDEMLAGPKPVDLVQALALPMPSLVICMT
jgi:cytochrome P450